VRKIYSHVEEVPHYINLSAGAGFELSTDFLKTQKPFCYTRSKVNFSLGPFKCVDPVARKKIGVVATRLQKIKIITSMAAKKKKAAPKKKAAKKRV
jgi:hypothetical protein